MFLLPLPCSLCKINTSILKKLKRIQECFLMAVNPESSPKLYKIVAKNADLLKLQAK